MSLREMADMAWYQLVNKLNELGAVYERLCNTGKPLDPQDRGFLRAAMGDVLKVLAYRKEQEQASYDRVVAGEQLETRGQWSEALCRLHRIVMAQAQSLSDRRGAGTLTHDVVQEELQRTLQQHEVQKRLFIISLNMQFRCKEDLQWVEVETWINKAREMVIEPICEQFKVGNFDEMLLQHFAKVGLK